MQVREFEAPSFVATVTVFADERTAALVACPHFAAHSNWDRSARQRWCRTGSLGLRLRRPRLCGDAGLAFVYLGQQGVERSLDDRGRVAVGELVGEQILQLLELL